MTNLTPKKRQDWTTTFLATYREGGNVSEACKAANISRQLAYAKYHADAAFAKLWDAAGEEATDALEKIARQRAERQSDTLLIFLLKGLRPQKYRDNAKVEHDHGGAIKVQYGGKVEVELDVKAPDYGQLERDLIDHARKSVAGRVPVLGDRQPVDSDHPEP